MTDTPPPRLLLFVLVNEQFVSMMYDLYDESRIAVLTQKTPTKTLLTLTLCSLVAP